MKIQWVGGIGLRDCHTGMQVGSMGVTAHARSPNLIILLYNAVCQTVKQDSQAMGFNTVSPNQLNSFSVFPEHNSPEDNFPFEVSS